MEQLDCVVSGAGGVGVAGGRAGARGGGGGGVVGAGGTMGRQPRRATRGGVLRSDACRAVIETVVAADLLRWTNAGAVTRAGT